MSTEPSNREISDAITKLGGEFADLRGEVGAMHECLVGFHEVVATHFRRVVDGIAVLKRDVGEIKRDVAVIKSDITVIKYDVSELKDDLRR